MFGKYQQKPYVMKKFFIIIWAILISIFCNAYEWDSIGPANVYVNNFNVAQYNIAIEILCTSDGILIHEGNAWNSYNNAQLPALTAVGLDPDNLLVLLGDGSWSDGIYKFNLTSHQFEIVEWIAFLKFLHYCEISQHVLCRG